MVYDIIIFAIILPQIFYDLNINYESIYQICSYYLEIHESYSCLNM